MEMSFKTEGPICVARVLKPRIDAPVAVDFKETLRQGTAATAQLIILDLSAVDFVDSSGLGAIVGVMKTLGADRRLVLAGLTPNVQRVFSLTRMDSVFEIHPTVKGALDEHPV